MTSPISVFLLDDHEVVRRGVRDLLEAEPDIQVVGEAGTAASALARIACLMPTSFDDNEALFNTRSFPPEHE